MLNWIHIFICLSMGTFAEQVWPLHDPGGSIRQVIACAPHPLNMSCPGDSTIQIHNGNYGRFTITLCNDQGAQNWSVNCYMSEAVSLMRSECNGKSSCAIAAESFAHRTDPCSGTQRYLEAHYTCTKKTGGLVATPPWMKLGFQDKGGRVPITAPPTTTTTTTTTTTKTTTTTTATTTTTRYVTTASTSTTTLDKSLVTRDYKYSSSSGARINQPVSGLNPPQGVLQVPQTTEGEGSRPRTGARVRDDFIPELRDITTTTQRIPVPLSEVWCEPEVRRNILWPGSRIETVARVPCPSGTLGTGRRRCSVQGWEAPLLVECSSNWLLALVSELPFTPDTSSLTLTLHTNIQRLNLYGGDIKVILELVETSLQRWKLKKNMFQGRFRDQSLSQFSQVLSFLLERESLAAWMDLSPTSFEALRTRLLEVLQELCLSLYPVNPNLIRSSLHLDPESLKPGAEPYSFIFPNFECRLSLVPSSTPWSWTEKDPEQGSEPTLLLGADSYSLSVSSSPFIDSISTNSSVLAVLGVTRVDTIFSVPEQSKHISHVDAPPSEQIKLVTRIVSIYSGSVKNRFVTQAVNFTLAHTIPGDTVHKRCVHWDLQRQGWTSSGCTTIQTNLSHTSCSCQYISTYTVLQDTPGYQDLEMILVIILVSTLSLLLVLLTIGCLVVWRRSKETGLDVDGSEDFACLEDPGTVCRIHPGYSTYKPGSRPRGFSSHSLYLHPLDLQQTGDHRSDLRQGDLEQQADLLSGISTPERPILRRNWSNHCSNPSGHVYAEPESLQYEPTDSGFTEEWSDLTSDRKEESIYTSSSSSNTGLVAEETQEQSKFRTHRLILEQMESKSGVYTVDPNLYSVGGNTMYSIDPKSGVYTVSRPGETRGRCARGEGYLRGKGEGKGEGRGRTMRTREERGKNIQGFHSLGRRQDQGLRGSETRQQTRNNV